ncbi:O-antigen ligase family protein [Novosphingobium sp. G106]|uniref:O-antigen ligase family protein n=1 Tax=Novosphingobium sp. G106 TaxID=2849500 RepID=UPI001C2DE611|nr:O-antigen ligase family protein [Novosphingobium sp. G106]MBV1689582.1 O-antigen ligase family protein [Novosphingobium sp. G106]
MGFALPRFRWKRRDPRPRVGVLQPYARPGYWQRHRRFGLTLLGIFAFFYGAFFGITTIYLLVQLVVPLLVLVLLVIWLLPETGKAPVKAVEWLFFAFMYALLLWPNYLALAIPGLPWITAIRMAVAPLAILFLISLSQSASFRAELKRILDSCPLVWKMATAYTILNVISCIISIEPSTSLRGLVIVLSNWTLIFFVAAYVLSKDGRVEKFAHIVSLCALVVCLIGVWEARIGAVPWAGHIPSFLKIEDNNVEAILAGATRGGAYRVQSKFTTPLSLAEFISCALPFVFYVMVYGKRTIFRILAVPTVPLIFYVVVKTDARLGLIGCLVALVLFPALYGLKTLKSDKSSLVAPAIVMGIPAAGVMFFIITLFIGRVGKMIWGSGEQSLSTQTRYDQLHSAMPKILSHPWGYGLDKGAEVLNYRLESGFLTIDSYYLCLALDLGVLGFVTFVCMLLGTVYVLLNAILRAEQIDRELTLMGVVLIVVAQFAITKLVLAQVETHAYFFAVLGGAVALAYRHSVAKAAEPAAQLPVEKKARPIRRAQPALN